VPVLSGVTSVDLEEISLSILQFPDGNDSSLNSTVSMEWGDVDAILAGPQFMNLKSVSVRHVRFSRLKNNTCYPLEWFLDRLPRCYEQGILRVCETETQRPFI